MAVMAAAAWPSFNLKRRLCSSSPAVKTADKRQSVIWRLPRLQRKKKSRGGRRPRRHHVIRPSRLPESDQKTKKKKKKKLKKRNKNQTKT